MITWIPIEQPPEHDAPCEYQIVVTCRGWYRPNGDEPRFAADERKSPVAILINWKPWIEGECWEKGMKAVREFRMNKHNDIDE